jgi:hypothetical protein
VDNITLNINEPSTANNSDNNSWNSLRTLSTPYFPLHLTDESVLIKIEFDAGITPPSTTLPVYYKCGQSLTLDSIGSFDLEDTAIYPIPTDPLEKIALKQCQIRENYNCPYTKFPFREERQLFQFYRTIKYNQVQPSLQVLRKTGTNNSYILLRESTRVKNVFHVQKTKRKDKRLIFKKKS